MARLLSLVPQFILVPYLIRTIGEVGYGIYALIWSLMMSIDQLERSLQSGVVKYCAGFLALGRTSEINSTVSSSLIYSILLAVLGCGGVLIASVLYDDQTGQVTSALILVGLLLLFTIPLTPYIAIIQSRQRYYLSAIVDVISKYIGLAAIFLWFRLVSPSVYALIAIMMVMLLLSRFVQVPMAYKLVPGLHINPRLFEMKNFRLIALFGASTVLASACLALNSTGIRWLMNYLESTAFVTHLAITLMPGLLLSYLIGAMVITVMPATSAYSTTNNQIMLQELMVRGMRYISVFALSVLLAFGLTIESLFSFWVGREYKFLIPYTLSILTSVAFLEITSVSHHMLKGMDRLKVVIYIYFIGLVVVPFASIFAIFWKSGNAYLSVCLGLVAGNLTTGILQTIFCAKLVKINLIKLILQVFIYPFSIAIVVALIAYQVELLGAFNHMVSQILVSLLAIILFLGGCYILITSSLEKRWIGNTLEMFSRKMLSFLASKTD
ncbi:MAG: lipopolysaccharide biosynthesis protein [Nitrospira sp.]